MTMTSNPMPRDDRVYQFDESGFADAVRDTVLEPFVDKLIAAVVARGDDLKHGNLPHWRDAVEAAPTLDQSSLAVVDGVVCINSKRMTQEECSQLKTALTSLMPWRKGPFRFGDITVDTEWRSDWKWNRLVQHLQDLHGRNVLDVGCGSGYHLWRMRESGARLALGIDPSLLFIHQFALLQRYAQDVATQYLPLTMDSLPSPMLCFDTVFSMGVLYHRREPLEHLDELRVALRPGGELVLETLVLPDASETHDTSLAIDGRYASMRNIWELPTPTRLLRWVAESGFKAARLVSLEQTTIEEQRATPWMTQHSLSEALDPIDQGRTVEGHPRPCRAIVLAET